MIDLHINQGECRFGPKRVVLLHGLPAADRGLRGRRQWRRISWLADWATSWVLHGARSSATHAWCELVFHGRHAVGNHINFERRS